MTDFPENIELQRAIDEVWAVVEATRKGSVASVK
jgi:hypothetical protein